MNTDVRIVPILNPRIARDLIQQQRFSLVDIRANKSDKNRTVFIFQDTECLKEYLLNEYKIQI